MIKTAQQHIHCQNCNFSHLCLPLALKDDELETLNRIVKRNRPLHKNDLLVEASRPMKSLFAVRTGAFKSYLVDSNGEYQITGFHLPGDIIGLDGFAMSQYVSSTQALETSMVCEIPMTLLDEASAAVPNLKAQLMRFMSEEINEFKQNMMLLNKRDAEARVLFFLLSLSRRFEVRGFSATDFVLPMTRTDIGNYLGLTVETVSRLFTRLQKDKIINVQGKAVSLHKKAEMESMLRDNDIKLPKVG